MFALSAVNFCYDKDQFFALTPYEFSYMMQEKAKDDFERFEFLRSELRTANYFKVITSMNEFKGVSSPQDLYKIPSDNEPIQSDTKPIVDQDLLAWARAEVLKN